MIDFMDTSLIIKRIEKLLNLAESKDYNPREAAVALNKAINLANEYDIDITSISKSNNEVTEYNMSCDKDEYSLYSLFISKLSSYYRVVFLIKEDPDRYNFVFIGNQLDLSIFSQSVNYLLGFYKVCLNKRFHDRKSLFYVYRNNKDKIKGYMLGFIVGVLETLNSLKTDIVLSKTLLLEEARSRFDFETKENSIEMSTEVTSTVNIGVKDGKDYKIHGTLSV